MHNFDLVSSLHALPESNPIEVDGISFDGGGGPSTCGSQCVVLTVQVIATVCAILATCC